MLLDNSEKKIDSDNKEQEMMDDIADCLFSMWVKEVNNNEESC